LSIARLLAGALAQALLAACGPDWNALDPSLGGAATASTSTTRTTTTGTGETGQTTTTSTTTTTTSACSSPAQCPGTDTICASRTCTSGVCGMIDAPSATHCGASGSGRHCDGAGNCI
jgi:hypothetical protein